MSRQLAKRRFNQAQLPQHHEALYRNTGRRRRWSRSERQRRRYGDLYLPRSSIKLSQTTSTLLPLSCLYIAILYCIDFGLLILSCVDNVVVIIISNLPRYEDTTFHDTLCHLKATTWVSEVNVLPSFLIEIDRRLEALWSPWRHSSVLKLWVDDA